MRYDRVCVLMSGSPFDGMTCWGPFRSREAAIHWLDNTSSQLRHDTWWVCEVHREPDMIVFDPTEPFV